MKMIVVVCNSQLQLNIRNDYLFNSASCLLYLTSELRIT